MDRSLFFFNDTATTEIYTLSLHDALPIFTFANVIQVRMAQGQIQIQQQKQKLVQHLSHQQILLVKLLEDRKSTRLNSSHANISYAVFCLKKNNNPIYPTTTHITQLSSWMY